jgi:hypothetical protein
VQEIIGADANWSHALTAAKDALDNLATSREFRRRCWYSWRNILAKQYERFAVLVGYFVHAPTPISGTVFNTGVYAIPPLLD